MDARNCTLTFFRSKKPTGPEISVEVKILGMFGADFLSEAHTVQVALGASPIDAIDEMHKSGAISKEIYKLIRKLKPPYFLVLNDEKQEGKPKLITLKEGDQISIMQAMAGG
jgi:molybdopterin converting factor small subunit